MKNNEKKWGGKRPNSGRKQGQPLKKESEKLSETIAFGITKAEKEVYQSLSYDKKEALKQSFRAKLQYNQD